MSETSGRLALPFIMPGQAQKEMTHNEALARIDIAATRSVSGEAGEPPIAPVEGECWIVGASPEGAWSGHKADLAGWTDGGWRFVVPWEGLSVWRIDRGCEARFRGGSWQAGIIVGERLMLGGQAVFGGRVPAIARPVGGGSVDAEARSAVNSLIAALQHHGLMAGPDGL